jgi:formylglycine-generating enzyme required for sulfatase activity
VVGPSGSFTMGSPKSEPGRDDDEGQQHRVTIAKAFAVGKFTVTFDEWDACVADGGCNAPSVYGYNKPEDKGWGRGKQPVIEVNWPGAKSYAAWLSKTTGKTYRLLSESEWEYAARAGTTTPFWWGSSISTSQANYVGTKTYNNGRKGEYRQRTVPVDSFAPNGFGLYNVHGNVWQWVEDCYANNYDGAATDGSARTSGDCTKRVLRGGSWDLTPESLRAATRARGDPDYSYIDIGFRLARTLDP